MRSGGHQAVAFWRLLLLVLGLTLWPAVVVAKDKPNVVVTSFEHPPVNLRYFEDSDIIVFHDRDERSVYRSDDAGASWSVVDAVPEHEAEYLIMHQFEPSTAFILTKSATHYKTQDRGKSWTKFNSGSMPSDFQPDILMFHADDADRIIFNGMECEGPFCNEEATYTTDGFKDVEFLRAFTNGCWWARGTKEFTTGDDKLDKNRIMCITLNPFSLFDQAQQLVFSDSFFEVKDKVIEEFEPDMGIKKGVESVVNLATVKGYLMVATSAANSDELALYVTDDAITWHRAMFPTDDTHDHSHRISAGAFTVLESTNYSIQIDVMTSHPSTPMGVLFTSNSNGTYFTENVPWTNRNQRGNVDFEKISGIQGVYLVNVVENGEEVEEKGEEKKIVTKITFDDGRTFDPVKSGDDAIHLHSETELDNIGRIYSSPAPGLVMGNGNTGKSLGDFWDSNLFVSNDAGLTWKKALDGPHKYEFGDSGSILVAVKDSKDSNVNEFFYSLDHGDNWESMKFPDDLLLRPHILTTTQDSTSLKFVLIGEREGAYSIIAIDFGGLDQRTCGKDDMEDWNARADDDGNPTCIMGHKQTYSRRKKSAECFVKADFKDPEPITDDCECTDADFECDYNFQRDPEDRSKCVKVGPVIKPDGACKGGPDDVFKGTSGWRLVPGNTCKRAKGEQKDDEVERKCSDVVSPPTGPGSGKVALEQHVFETKMDDFQKIYLERGETGSGSDATVIARGFSVGSDGRVAVDNDIWMSNDHGKEWKQILDGEGVRGIFPHSHFKDIVYFATSSTKVIYSIDRGHSFHSFEAPNTPGEQFPLSFHPDQKDWLIWIGETCDEVGGSKTCFPSASLSKDRGDNWETILRFAERCEFTGSKAFRFRPQKQIVCLAHTEESTSSPLTVITSDDFFEDDKQAFDGEVLNFATMSEFIVLAGHDKETEDLEAYASLNGKTFEQAHFPYNFHEGHDNDYTVLDSSTHAVNLFVLNEEDKDRKFGTIVKSNSNGTSYVVSATQVNANDEGYVDFEKVPGLEGVTLINQVANPDKKQKTKTLQTRISHNDGSEWGYLPPPAKDIEGKSFKCSSKGDKSCALHLHHYTERDDKRKTFAASTAVGLMFGVGNVGSELGDISEADTFMTTDAGISWKMVKKGHWTWQYGDQGSIIVLVQRATRQNDVKTKIISYSTDEGENWTDIEFADSDVTVLDITTVSSGISRNFLLWCRSGKGKLFTVSLDFTGLADEPCKLTDGKDSDYYLWSPKHPLQNDDCLFGHKSQYLRKKVDSVCYNEQSLQRLIQYTDCDCTRRDYECDYNFELDNHGQCKLVPGFQPISGQEWCAQNPNETSWFEPTGYRKVPLSTCKGGNELDKTSTEHPCDGYEDEFEKKHRTSGVAVFFAVVIPFALAGAIGTYIYRNWHGKFGQIRLGDNSSTFDSDQPWVKYPVIAVSAVGAVAAATPLLLSSLWRTLTGAYERVGGSRNRSWFSGGNRRFTTRDSFARGRGDYSAVDDDEGELLGEESDDEV